MSIAPTTQASSLVSNSGVLVESIRQVGLKNAAVAVQLQEVAKTNPAAALRQAQDFLRQLNGASQVSLSSGVFGSSVEQLRFLSICRTVKEGDARARDVTAAGKLLEKMGVC